MSTKSPTNAHFAELIEKLRKVYYVNIEDNNAQHNVQHNVTREVVEEQFKTIKEEYQRSYRSKEELYRLFSDLSALEENFLKLGLMKKCKSNFSELRQMVERRRRLLKTSQNGLGRHGEELVIFKNNVMAMLGGKTSNFQIKRDQRGNIIEVRVDLCPFDSFTGVTKDKFIDVINTAANEGTFDKEKYTRIVGGGEINQTRKFMTHALVEEGYRVDLDESDVTTKTKYEAVKIVVNRIKSDDNRHSVKGHVPEYIDKMNSNGWRKVDVGENLSTNKRIGWVKRKLTSNNFGDVDDYDIISENEIKTYLRCSMPRELCNDILINCGVLIVRNPSPIEVQHETPEVQIDNAVDPNEANPGLILENP